jgi:hypothetical protein
MKIKHVSIIPHHIVFIIAFMKSLLCIGFLDFHHLVMKNILYYLRCKYNK